MGGKAKTKEDGSFFFPSKHIPQQLVSVERDLLWGLYKLFPSGKYVLYAVETSGSILKGLSKFSEKMSLVQLQFNYWTTDTHLTNLSKYALMCTYMHAIFKDIFCSLTKM